MLPLQREDSVRELFVNRQAIFDRHLSTVAYELRFGFVSSSSTDGEALAARQFFRLLFDRGLEALVGTRQALLSHTSATMCSLLPELLPLLPVDRLILAIPLDFGQSESERAFLRQLATQGCSLLAELPCPHQPNGDPLGQALLELADIVRIQVPAAPSIQHRPLERWLRECLATVTALRPSGLQVFVADIHDYHVFRLCRDLGADLFLGDFLFRPLPVQAQPHPVSPAGLLLLARLLDATIDFDEVEHLFAQDIELTYKLLRLVNTVWFARRTRIESLRQALLVLGLRNVASWVAVLVLAGVQRKPSELVRIALVRARMCELLAGALPSVARDSAFLVGLLSLLDAVLDRPLAEALAPLPISHELEVALLNRSGLLGTILQAVLAYESGDWTVLPDLPLSSALLTEAYIDALAYAAEALSALDVVS